MNLAKGNLKTFPDLSSITKEEFHLNNNYVGVIPEDFLPRGVKVLDLKYNSIQSDGLPVVFPNTIERLELDGNRIRDFRDVQQFPSNLKSLSVNDNPLNTLEDLYSLLSLEFLDIGRTNLDGISLLPQCLVQLLASKCYRLRMLPNRFPPTLRVATLNDCCLRYASLPGYWGVALEELNLAFNEIDRFPRNLPPTLKTLNLTHNRIREVPEEFNQKFPHLEVCMLAFNKLRRVPVKTRARKLAFVDVRDNELIVSLEEQNRIIERTWAETISEGQNWMGREHIISASLIQKNWRLARMQRRLRTWKRTRVVREELLCVSMMPERVWQTDVISDEWRRA
jgi:Leucine-rich repeat (LRR) protein